MKYLVVCLGILVIFFGTVYFFGWTSRDRSILLSSPQKFKYGGVERTYLISRTSAKPKKLVIALGGYGTSARNFAYFTGLHNSVSASTIVVYPDPVKSNDSSIPIGWNAGFCCGSGMVQKTDDEHFIIALALLVGGEYGMNIHDTSLVGFSNGAMLAMRIANDYPDDFRAVASIAGTIGTPTNFIQPKKPTTMLLIQGKKDPDIPFSLAGPNAANRVDFADTLSAWQRANDCSAATNTVLQTKDYALQTYAGCSKPLETIVYQNIGHEWPGARSRLWPFGESQTEASRQIADFFASE